jgi:hypothetical protein
VNRRLRLALLLAAMAAAGPSVPATQAFDAARTSVSIAWLRANPAIRPEQETEKAGLKSRLYGAITGTREFAARDRVLPDTLRVHSLFQRPPPLHS